MSMLFQILSEFQNFWNLLYFLSGKQDRFISLWSGALFLQIPDSSSAIASADTAYFMRTDFKQVSPTIPTSVGDFNTKQLLLFSINLENIVFGGEGRWQQNSGCLSLRSASTALRHQPLSLIPDIDLRLIFVALDVFISFIFSPFQHIYGTHPKRESSQADVCYSLHPACGRQLGLQGRSCRNRQSRTQ